MKRQFNGIERFTVEAFSELECYEPPSYLGVRLTFVGRNELAQFFDCYAGRAPAGQYILHEKQ